MSIDTGETSILWDDHSVQLSRHVGISVAQLDASIFSGRSVDSTNGVFTLQANVDDYYLVGYGGGQVSVDEQVHTENFVQRVTGTPADTQIVKTGAGRVYELIASRNPLVLSQPPQQSAVPTVARMWETYPKVNSLGQYLGATSRQLAGELSLNMQDLTRAWIEQYWEPFREHAAKGGVFAYLLRGSISAPAEIAYCYASKNIPAPKIAAGGYGSVSLSAGVATI